VGTEDRSNDKALAIYHVMRPRENFDDTADILFQLVKKAAAEHPGRKRALYLDIEGHRNKAGGFDSDALELQQHFVIRYLGRWLSEVSMPLIRATTPGQHEDLPDFAGHYSGAEHGQPRCRTPGSSASDRCTSVRQRNW
jgi:hypothetical protein